MKNYFLFITVLFTITSKEVNAQNFSPEEQQQIDSLNAIINNKSNRDTILVNTLLKLPNYYYLQNPDTAIIICRKAESISENISYLKGQSNSYEWLGFLLQNQGNIPLALEYYHKSLKINEEIGNKQGMALSLNNIGVIHDDQGDILLALEYYHKSLKIDKEIGNQNGMGGSFNNIGYIHHNQAELAKSRSDLSASDSLINLALQYYHKSLKIREEIGDKSGIANSLNNIGNIHYNQGNIALALEFYYKSLKILEEIGHKLGMANSLASLGGVYLEQGALANAKKRGEQGLRLAQELGYPDQIKRNASLLTKVYTKEGNYKLAFEMRNLEIQMRDSLLSEENMKSAVQQQAKFDYEKQKVADSITNEEAEKVHLANLEAEKAKGAQQQAEIAAQKKQNIFLFIGLGLVAFFGFFMYNRFKVTRKQKGIIEEAHHQLEEKNQEIMDSITYAKRIQSAILPPAKLVKEYLKENFILYKPKDVVAGDFYWMEHRDGKVLFAAADCTGHGVPGAMVSVVCNNALNRSVREHGLTDPGQILTKTREIVIQEFEKSEEEVKDGMDIALCSLEGNKLQYAGANIPLWIIRNGELIETIANKQPIGKFDNPKPYTTHSFELQKGDSIYIFSDGYVDQFGGEKGKKFKAKAFRELLLSIQDKSMEGQKTIIDGAFETWRGTLEQIDDVCVIGVKIE